MGLFSSLFSDKSDGVSTKVRSSNSNKSHIRGDQYTSTKTSDGKSGHVHRSYDSNASSGGGYREYTGGENSTDRSYNK